MRVSACSRRSREEKRFMQISKGLYLREQAGKVALRTSFKSVIPESIATVTVKKLSL
jgi:hypothetical protein